MRKQVLNIFTVIALCAAVVSCKKAKEANTSEAEAASVSETTSQKYVVNVEESFIAWKGFKPTGTHNGTVNIENGILHVDNGLLKSGTFLIDMKSIVSEDLEGDMKMNLEAHLKGTAEGKEGDFFNVTKFPTGAFEITGSEADKDGKTMLSGNLTIKEMKHNVTFPVYMNIEGDGISVKSEAFTIDRTKWGVNYGSKTIFDNLGDKFINDDMELSLFIKAKK